MSVMLEKLLLLLGPLLTALLSRLKLSGPSESDAKTKAAIKKAVKDGDTSDLEDDFRDANS